MAKFVYKNTCPSVANYLNKVLFIIKVIWPSNITWRSKKGILIWKQTQFCLLHEKNAWDTRKDNHTKKLESSMLALCPGRCLLHHKGIENYYQTIFSHVTAGNVKFAVSQWPTSQPFNFLYETRLYRGNAILKILYRRLEKIVRDSRILVDEKASDFVLSWTFVQNLLLAGVILMSCHL